VNKFHVIVAFVSIKNTCSCSARTTFTIVWYAGMLTRSGTSEAEAEVEAEARDVALYMNAWTPNRKFINTYKSHFQQCQCTIQKLTSIEYTKQATISYRRRKERNIAWFWWLTARPRGQSSWERGQHCMRTRPRPPNATRPRPKILASRPGWPRGITSPMIWS